MWQPTFCIFLPCLHVLFGNPCASGPGCSCCSVCFFSSLKQVFSSSARRRATAFLSPHETLYTEVTELNTIKQSRVITGPFLDEVLELENSEPWQKDLTTWIQGGLKLLEVPKARVIRIIKPNKRKPCRSNE